MESQKRRFTTLIKEYYASHDYTSLAPTTQRDYRYCLEALLSVVLGATEIRKAWLHEITTPKAQAAYNELLKRGVSFANHTRAVASKVFTYAIQLGYVENNPFRNVARRPQKPRRVVWSKEHIAKFLETAYSTFEWRSVGLIVQMAYEWCQRLGDMSNLTWDNYDFDRRVLTLEQSKRRAKVELPTTDELHAMLVQQNEEVGFQPYMAPVCHRRKVLSRPYSKYNLTLLARKIMNAAGLPKELQIMDMRRTGTVEMIDAGVPMPQIMSVTGHANPQSVKPYMKHTLTSARAAATLRFNTAGDT